MWAIIAKYREVRLGVSQNRIYLRGYATAILQLLALDLVTEAKPWQIIGPRDTSHGRRRVDLQ